MDDDWVGGVRRFRSLTPSHGPGTEPLSRRGCIMPNATRPPSRRVELGVIEPRDRLPRPGSSPAQINAFEAVDGGAPAISSTATAPGTLGVFA